MKDKGIAAAITLIGEAAKDLPKAEAHAALVFLLAAYCQCAPRPGPILRITMEMLGSALGYADGWHEKAVAAGFTTGVDKEPSEPPDPELLGRLLRGE